MEKRENAKVVKYYHAVLDPVHKVWRSKRASSAHQSIVMPGKALATASEPNTVRDLTDMVWLLMVFAILYDEPSQHNYYRS